LYAKYLIYRQATSHTVLPHHDVSFPLTKHRDVGDLCKMESTTATLYVPDRLHNRIEESQSRATSHTVVPHHDVKLINVEHRNVERL
jgi:hypothetical protein